MGGDEDEIVLAKKYSKKNIMSVSEQKDNIQVYERRERNKEHMTSARGKKRDPGLCKTPKIQRGHAVRAQSIV